MRDVVINRELEHLGVDHDEFAFVRCELVDERHDHRVDGDRFARAGGAGDQHVRHARQVGDDRLAGDVLAEHQRQARLGLLVDVVLQQLAQVDRLAVRVGQLDAERVASRDHRYPRRDGAHAARDVVRKADDARGFDARRRLQLVQRDDRARPHAGDLALDAVVVQHRFEQPRVLLQRALGKLLGPFRRVFLHQRERGHGVAARARPQIERALRLVLFRALGLDAFLRHLQARAVMRFVVLFLVVDAVLFFIDLVDGLFVLLGGDAAAEKIHRRAQPVPGGDAGETQPDADRLVFMELEPERDGQRAEEQRRRDERKPPRVQKLHQRDADDDADGARRVLQPERARRPGEQRQQRRAGDEAGEQRDEAPRPVHRFVLEDQPPRPAEAGGDQQQPHPAPRSGAACRRASRRTARAHCAPVRRRRGSSTDRPGDR